MERFFSIPLRKGPIRPEPYTRREEGKLQLIKLD